MLIACTTQMSEYRNTGFANTGLRRKAAPLPSWSFRSAVSPPFFPLSFLFRCRWHLTARHSFVHHTVRSCPSVVPFTLQTFVCVLSLTGNLFTVSTVPARKYHFTRSRNCIVHTIAGNNDVPFSICEQCGSRLHYVRLCCDCF